MEPLNDDTDRLNLIERVTLFRHALIARLLPAELTPTVRAAEAQKHIHEQEVVAVSTVHRLFQRLGLITPKTHSPQDRRRYAFANADQLWMHDVMHIN